MTQQRTLMIAVLAVSTTMLSAQTPRPTFEVASIKKLDQMVTGFEDQLADIPIGRVVFSAHFKGPPQGGHYA